MFVFALAFFAAIGVDIGVGSDWWSWITFPFGLTSWFKWAMPPNGVTWTISTMMFFVRRMYTVLVCAHACR